MKPQAQPSRRLGLFARNLICHPARSAVQRKGGALCGGHGAQAIRGIEVVNANPLQHVRLACLAHVDEGALVLELGQGRRRFEAEFPDLDVVWLDTAESQAEVFFAPAAALPAPRRRAK